MPRVPLLLLLALLALAHGQLVVPGALLDPNAKCLPFDPLIGRTCSGIITAGAPIYVNSSLSLAGLEQIAVAYSALSGLAAAFPDCVPLALDYLCHAVYTECVVTPITNTSSINMSISPCPELCQRVNTNCQALKSFGFQDIVCTPELSYDFTAQGGSVVSLPCYNGTTGEVNLTCLRPEFQDSSKQCALRCPLAPVIWGDARVRRLEVALEVISGIGMIGCFFVMLLYIANPKLRPFPGWIVIATSFGLFLLSWGVFMTTWYGSKEIVCDPDPDMRRLCKAQGVFIVLGAYVGTLFWLALNIFSAIISGPWSNPITLMNMMRKYQLAFLLVLIPVPIGMGLCAKHFGTNTSLPYCILDDPKKEERYLVWPVATFVFSGTILWLFTFYHTTLAFWRKGKAGLSAIHIRHILYEFAALVPGVIYVVAFEARRDRWTNVDRLVAYLSGTTDVFRPPTYAEFCLVLVNTAVIALLHSLIYLTRMEHYVFVRCKMHEWKLLTYKDYDSTRTTSMMSTSRASTSNSAGL